MNKIKCDFCNKPILEKQYKLTDKYRSYIICDKCNSRALKYQKEYGKEALKLNNDLTKKLNQLSNRLRIKYKLKKIK